MRYRFFYIIIFLQIAVFAFAQSNQDRSLQAYRLIDQGRVAQGVAILEELVAMPGGDNPDDMFMLAVQYYKGAPDLQRDFTRAYQYFLRSAQKGNEEAMYSLGVMYEKGEYGDPDYRKAREWFEKAAAQGHTKAQQRVHNLQAMNQEALDLYESALLDIKRFERNSALKKLKQAHEMGLIEATVKLGDMYAQGLGTRNRSGSNITEAKRYYEYAARHDHPHAMYLYAFLLENSGDSRELRSAHDWYLKAAEYGDSTALTHSAIVTYKTALRLSESDEEFRGDKGRDRFVAERGELLTEAKELLEEPAAMGDPLACFYMGLMCRYDYAKAQQYLLQATGRLYDTRLEDELQVLLGDCYRFGNHDYAKANAAYEKARRNGNTHGIVALALSQVEMNNKNSSDRKKAENDAWTQLDIASRQDNMGYALYGIALCYRDGIGVKKNKDNYRTYLAEAAVTYHLPEALYEYANTFCMKDKKTVNDPDHGFAARVNYVKMAAQEGYPPAVDQVAKAAWPAWPH